MAEEKESCSGCSRCCRDIAVEIDKPEDFDDFEEIKWMIAHKNVSVYIDDENDWLVEFITECQELDENNRCKIYDKRYPVCRDHDPSECIKNGEGEHYERIFRTAEDVDEYMKEIGFYEKYLEKKKEMMSKSSEENKQENNQ